MPADTSPPPRRASPATLFALVLLGIGAIASAEFYAVWRSHGGLPAASASAAAAPRSGAAGPANAQSGATDAAKAPAGPDVSTSAPAPATDAAPGIEGALDRPADEAMVGPRIALSGWALARRGVRAVEIRVGERRFPATLGIARPDVAQAKPGYADAAHAGFEFTGDLTPHPAPAGIDRRELTVVAIASDGAESVLARRSVVEPDALARWSFVRQGRPFHLLPALSGIGLGGAAELDTAYRAYRSRTMVVGMRVPILYLRTTKGAVADYAYDPAWDIERRCGDRRIAEDTLDGTLALAAAKRLAVLVTLNGGIWADAACDVPAWDINDRLEQDPANCQWNDRGEVMPDDALKHLPGSQEAPELGRSLTFNVYAKAVRHYKRRNLQQAASRLVTFMRSNPALLVGVNLDPDTYLNPFFSEKQWYDYNPGTLRQFREWLSATGPYAGRPRDGAPDLSAYRRAKPLTLAEAGRLAGRPFARWDDVDPPRVFSRDPAHPFWRDPWVHEWEMFRRHLVKLHYDELSTWLVQVGIPRDRIWTSQGLMAPLPNGMPFALHIDSPVKDADSGGMSIEGSVPRDGHLGVILYGASAVNDIPMENGRPLFPTLAAFDPGFGVVEYNTADLRNPQAQPTYAAAYRGLRDLWNAGARYVSPMAWNGSNGVNAGKPGYVTYTAWRNTPLEEAARDFMLARAGLPLGTRLWTFGTARHADGDGWVAQTGAAAIGFGRFTLTPDAGRVALVSPGDLLLPRAAARSIVLGLPDDVRVRRVEVQAAWGGRPEWHTLARADGASVVRRPAGQVVSLPAAQGPPIDRLKVLLELDAAASVALTRVAVLP